MKRILDSPIFWIILILGLLAVLVLVFERPAPYTPLQEYQIFGSTGLFLPRGRPG